MGLLDHMATLFSFLILWYFFLILWYFWYFILFSIVAAAVYIPTSGVGGFPLHQRLLLACRHICFGRHSVSWESWFLASFEKSVRMPTPASLPLWQNPSWSRISLSPWMRPAHSRWPRPPRQLCYWCHLPDLFRPVSGWLQMALVRSAFQRCTFPLRQSPSYAKLC